MTNGCKLSFIYNADSGLFNTVSDIAHKIFSPKTYECQLCKITHGWFSMHEQWREGVTRLGCELEYLHRDQLAESGIANNPNLVAEKLEFPCVLFQDSNGHTHLLLTPEQINRFDGVDQLLKAIEVTLEEFRAQ